MKAYLIFLKKELIEAAKTYKLLTMGAVFFIFGLMSPLIARLMPEIMRWAMSTDPSTAGIDLSFLFSNPTALDAWVQFYSNVGQMGIIVLVIVFSGMLSSEISRGTLTIILTKGLTRWAAILAKFTSATIIWTACLTIAFLTSWINTIYLFPGDNLPNILLAVICLWLYGVFLLSLTTLMAALTKTTIFCMLSVGAGVVVLMILNVSSVVGKYNPITLGGSSSLSLLTDAITPQSLIPTFVATFIFIVAITLLSVIVFDWTKKTKMAAIIASLLAFSLLLTIFIGEEVPARISLSRYVITEKIVVGAGTEWEIEGKLTLPRRAEGKVPAVVLVHGSGSHNMDTKIFDNKPFKEIAEYLSRNGIAVLRYNKRGYTHGFKMMENNSGDYTVFEETIEDAILAANILKADPRIDETKVFILGHSLGAMMAPRIHVMGGDFAGLILFAGSPRFLLDIMKDQSELSIAAIDDAEEAAELQAIQDQFIATIEEGLLLPDEEAQNISLPEMGGLSVYYFKDLYENPIPKHIADTTVPILVMHAANDLQVYVDKDFNLYKELLAGRNNATFKLYEGLNHLFMPARVTCITELMDEYKVKANIEPQVLKDIAAWIKQHD